MMFGKAIRNIGLILGEEMEVMYNFQLIRFSMDIEGVKMDKIHYLCLLFKIHR